MVHPAQLPPDRLLAACSVERTRRGGPGGQHRNKVETAVVVTHSESGLRGEASERRSQAANLSQAIFRLRVRLALELRGPLAPGPSSLWASRTAGRRMAVSTEHEDFPALLAEALDALAGHDWSAAEAANFLGVSTTQLVKLLKLEPAALAVLNAERDARSLPRLR